MDEFKVKVIAVETFDVPTNPTAFLEFWANAFAQIPTESKGAAEVTFSCDCNGDVEARLVYMRPETAEEGQRRAMAARSMDARRIEQDLKELGRLKG